MDRNIRETVHYIQGPNTLFVTALVTHIGWVNISVLSCKDVMVMFWLS